MGWFGLGNYSDPEQVSPTYGAPLKGPGRFLQLLMRDLWDYVKANLMCCLCLLPSAAVGFILLTATSNFWLCLLGSLVAAIPVGGGICGMQRVLNRSVRDLGDGNFSAFLKGFRDNFRPAILPGILAVLEVMLMIYMLLFHEGISAFPEAWRLWGLLGICVMSLHILLQCCFPLLIVVDLPLKTLFYNSLILFFSAPGKNILCLVLTTLIYALLILFFPADLIVVLLLGPVLIGLIQQLLLWPLLDKQFHIAQRQAELSK